MEFEYGKKIIEVMEKAEKSFCADVILNLGLERPR